MPLYDDKHPGVVLVANMLERGNSHQQIKEHLDKASTKLQVDVNTGARKLDQQAIDDLRKYEVAELVVRSDVSNRVAQQNIKGIQEGRTPTGNGTTSARWQKTLDNQAKPAARAPHAGFSVKIGRQP